MFNRARITAIGCTIITAALVLGDVPQAKADLINPVLAVSTPLVFDATVDDTAPGPIVGRWATPNWTVTVQQGNLDGGGANNDIAVWAKHNVGPHAGEPAPNPIIVSGGFLNVVPGAAGAVVFRGTVEHTGAVIHHNNLRITYGFLAAGISQLHIEVEHSVDQGTQDPGGPQLPSQPPEPDKEWIKFIPTVSEWGMMVMGLLLFTVATIVIRRSRRAAAEA